MSRKQVDQLLSISHQYMPANAVAPSPGAFARNLITVNIKANERGALTHVRIGPFFLCWGEGGGGVYTARDFPFSPHKGAPGGSLLGGEGGRLLAPELIYPGHQTTPFAISAHHQPASHSRSNDKKRKKSSTQEESVPVVSRLWTPGFFSTFLVIVARTNCVRWMAVVQCIFAFVREIS